MAKEWARDFYYSGAWKKCRSAYKASVHYQCEICGKPGEELHHKVALTKQNINDIDITLNWDNLQLLCYDCHKRVTFNWGATAEGITFDEYGDVVTAPM